MSLPLVFGPGLCPPPLLPLVFAPVFVFAPGLCPPSAERSTERIPVIHHMASSISALAEAAERPDWVSLEEIDAPLRQRPLSYCIDEAVINQLLQSAPDARSKALTLSTALPYAGDWLNVIPSSTLGLHLQDKEFRCCLQYWLGLRMTEEGATCPICQGAADAYGDHQVGCGGNGDRIHRHDSIRDAIFSAAQSAAAAQQTSASQTGRGVNLQL